MNYYSEQDIREIVAGVLARSGLSQSQEKDTLPPVPVETSARHVHLTAEAVEALFGKGHTLTRKSDLSQPGQFLAEERVKIVTLKGEISRAAVLGPVRSATQVELSMTDCRILGIQAPVRLSGDLNGAADVLLVGPAGSWVASGSAIVAKAHVHMTPEDARQYGVTDGQHVGVRLHTDRPVTLDDVIIRVQPNFSLAVHVDTDETNAASIGKGTVASILTGR